MEKDNIFLIVLNEARLRPFQTYSMRTRLCKGYVNVDKIIIAQNAKGMLHTLYAIWH